MKLYGHPLAAAAGHAVVPEALSEITLVASPTELRRIAEFLSTAATTMERMGGSYSHARLSDWDRSFRSSPRLVVSSSSADDG